MDQLDSNSASRRENNGFGGSNTCDHYCGCMPSEEREDIVLNFFVEHGFPLPPKALYRALKVSENITFSYRTVQNILERLLEEDYVVRLDKDKLDEGVLRPLSADETGRRTYYFITEKGRDRVEKNSQ